MKSFLKFRVFSLALLEFHTGLRAYRVVFSGEQNRLSTNRLLKGDLSVTKCLWHNRGIFIIETLFDAYNESSGFDTTAIKADFEELYRLMNGKPLKEIDEIIYAVCALCRDHEKAGFFEGIKFGVKLITEITKSWEKYKATYSWVALYFWSIRKEIANRIHEHGTDYSYLCLAIIEQNICHILVPHTWNQLHCLSNRVY